MLHVRSTLRSTMFAVLLAAATTASAQGQEGGNASAGGVGSPGAPSGSEGVGTANGATGPNAASNATGIDTSLSEQQSADDPNVATETQERIGNQVNNRFDWGLLGLLGLAGLLGLRSRRRG